MTLSLIVTVALVLFFHLGEKGSPTNFICSRSSIRFFSILLSKNHQNLAFYNFSWGVYHEYLAATLFKASPERSPPLYLGSASTRPDVTFPISSAWDFAAVSFNSRFRIIIL
ncbi:hypothetical protein H9L39_01573 [Fusarium oxysporum f. sp. albedinis]|nr:hypothetical protein H9L39_01573 [Fusarium oxysporum f. sp. albedinis]